MLGVIVINITFNFVVKKTSIEKQTYLPKKKNNTVYVNNNVRQVKRLCSVLCSNSIALDSSPTPHPALFDHDTIRKKIIDPFCEEIYLLVQVNF